MSEQPPGGLAADGERRKKDDKVSARLSGFNEVYFSAGPPAALCGAISTTASGKFRAEIDDDARIIDYELSYEGLEGAVTQAPVEVRSLTPICPSEGSVSGTITPDQVLAQDTQGFEAGDFDELVRAIRAGAADANVHSTLFTPGEIRGHIDHGTTKTTSPSHAIRMPSADLA
ncbi:MAG: CHRD domain-containing protein [Candidatus Binatia bacterium]